MKKVCFLAFASFFVLSQIALAGAGKNIVDYRIKAGLMPQEKAVKGEETLTWLNDSDKPVAELQFHLYLNAFKNSHSTFMKESGGVHRGFKLAAENWGFIEIKKIQLADGTDLSAAFKFIQPDDGNKEDQTVIKVSLPEAVPPHKKITLNIEFYSKLPKIFARSGFYKNFFMVGQWFPKIGVLWNGRWNCHQYHSNSEFFADFGIYEVKITVPEEYVVGATGKRIAEAKNSDGSKTYTHYQEDIHDFAWAACPDFVEFKKKFTLEKPPVETEMILLIHRSHLNQKERYLSALTNGLEFYSQNYGAYPYPTITLIDPPLKAMAAGGMEYPTLFTSMSMSFMPGGIYLTEMVTIHEFGHNFWYGMVGSNEFEEAWLDEGINSYSEIKAMARYYGEDSSMLNCCGLKISDFSFQRLQVIDSGRMDPILKNSWEYSSSGSYSLNSYSKAALMLLTLENYLGRDVMSEIMKTYFERWSFRHPTSKDFIAVAEEVSNQELGWFFGQFLHSPDKLDYAVGSVRSELVREQEGIFEGKKEAGQAHRDTKGKKQENTYKNEVLVIRRGELIFPQEVLIVFENGEEIREKWDGRERWKRFIYFKPYRLKLAHLDPESKIALDVNYLNNSLMLKPKRTSALKYALSLMSNFQIVLSFISF
jgi:hypothetical protein